MGTGQDACASDPAGAGTATAAQRPGELDVDELAGALRVAIGMVTRRMRQLDMGDELTMPETSALSRLDRGGPATASDLARLERISPQSMGATVATLLERGLIARERDPQDGRRILLSVTEAGRELVHARRGARAAMIARALRDRFTPAELEQVKAVLPLLERLADKI